jgi:hypothetical protein
MRWAWLVSLFLPAALLALVAVTACGPSYQAVYEADVTFEHCYAMDDRADAPLQTKRDCWQTWRSRFAIGQSRDKLEYAAARAEALSRGTSLPTDDSMAAAAPGEAHVSQVVAPQLTNAFAPPPKTLDQTDGGLDPNDMVNASAPQITWSAASSFGAGGGAWSQDAGSAAPGSAPSGPAPTPTTSTTTKSGAKGTTRALALRDTGRPGGATTLPAAPGAACSGSCTKTFGECRDTCKGGACNACDTGYRGCMRGCFK